VSFLKTSFAEKEKIIKNTKYHIFDGVKLGMEKKEKIGTNLLYFHVNLLISNFLLNFK